MLEIITKRPENNRFLECETEMVVHHLENEDESKQGCYIDEVIEKANAMFFSLTLLKKHTDKDIRIVKNVLKKEHLASVLD